MEREAAERTAAASRLPSWRSAEMSPVAPVAGSDAPRSGALTPPKSPPPRNGTATPPPLNGVTPRNGSKRSESGAALPPEVDGAVKRHADAAEVESRPSGGITYQQLRRRLEEADAQGLLQGDGAVR